MSTKQFNVSGFNGIHIKFAMEIEILQSDTFSVSVSGSDTQLNNINVAQEGETLTISYNLNLMSIFAAPFSRIHARITLPELRGLSISGSARATVRGFNSPNEFDLFVSGASRLDFSETSVGDMKWDLSGASRIDGEIKAAGDVDFRISGASRIDIKGSARDIAVDATGASHMDLDGFAVRNAKFRLSGASHCTINLNGKLDAILDGASRLEYGGQPSLGEVRVTGASTLKRQ